MRKSFQTFNRVELDVHVWVDPKQHFTVVNIFAGKDEDVVEGIGVAKRNPEDEYDYNEGVNIATARALVDLASKFTDY
jgi:hypothetical protein